jgi:hypothetical protein
MRTKQRTTRYKLVRNVDGTFSMTLRRKVKFTGSEAECREWFRKTKEDHENEQQAKFDAFDGDIVTREILNAIMKEAKSFEYIEYNGVIKCKYTL